MNREIFISYSRKNYDAVIEIKHQIDAATGTECWIDLKGIESGSEQFIKDIIGGIDDCKVFLFMLSKESQQSEYALLELNYAKTQNKRVVLVNIDDCKMEGVFLFKYSLTDTIAWNNQPQRDKLIRDLHRWIGKKPNNSKLEQQLTPSIPIHDLEKCLEKLEKEVGDLELYKDSIGKYGYKDTTGKLVIPCKWDDAWVFSEGLAWVKDSNGKKGFINKAGVLVVPCKWDDAWVFSEGLACVMDSHGKWGFIDKTGELVVPCRWEGARAFSDGLACVQHDNSKWGFIDKGGALVVVCCWIRAEDYCEGMAKVMDSSNKYGFIDKAGKLVVPCKWNGACAFSEGLAMVMDSDDMCGFVDKNGEQVVPCKWEDAKNYYNGVAQVKGKVSFFGGSEWHTIDKAGKIIS